MHDDTRPESFDSVSDHELLERLRTRDDQPAARELHRRHQAALERCFAGVASGTADPVPDVLARFMTANPSYAEREHPSLLLCRVAFEVLAELPDTAHEPPADTIVGHVSERQLLELALARLPPRERAAILLHHHSVAATPDLDPAELDAGSTAQLARTHELLRATMEALRPKLRLVPPAT
ncbi:MAG: hypothetical protein IAG13_15225 [Deltaproteobacteria bacterium]|nr:hypothetical protein [Nannocystaceae bacterium]